MYLLSIHNFIFNEDCCENGFYKFYTNDISKVNDVLDLLKLTFLKRLSRENYILCECENIQKTTKGTCKYCKNRIPEIYKMLCTSEQLDKLEEHDPPLKGWDLSNKDYYLFEIDIFENNQCGCAEYIRLSDFDTILFEKYNESLKMKIIDRIPIFKYNLTEINESEKKIYDKYLDYIFYNNKIIKYSKFLKMINTDDNNLQNQCNNCYEDIINDDTRIFNEWE